MTSRAPTYRQQSGVRVGDVVRASGRRVHFVRTGDGREFRLGHAEALLLEEFAGPASALDVAVRTGLDERTVTTACGRLTQAGLLSDTSHAVRALGTPGGTRSVPRVERSGWAGRVVLLDPGRPLAGVVSRLGRRGTAAVWIVITVLALVSTAVTVAGAPELANTLAPVRSAPWTWIAVVLIGLGGTVFHEYGHAFASIASGGAASEFGVRWRGPFAAFYCRTDDVRVIRGRVRRAGIALAGPAFGLALAAPWAMVWAVAGEPTTAAVATVALVVSSAVNLLPFPPLDGYSALTHMAGSAGLVRDGLAAFARGRSGTAAGIAYVVTAGTIAGVGAVAVVALWWATLQRLWDGTAATLFLATEALVVLAVVVAVKKRRAGTLTVRSLPQTSATSGQPAPAADEGGTQ